MIILFPAAFLNGLTAKAACNIWHIKARQILFIVKQSFLFIPYASRCIRLQKKEGRGEGKGKPEGDGEKIMRIMLGKIFRRSDKTEKARSASAQQIPQTP